MNYVVGIICILIAGHVYFLQDAKDTLHNQVEQLQKQIELDTEDCKMKLFYDKQISRIDGCQRGMTKACEDLSNFDTILCIETLIKYCEGE
jgi:hypothetical protein